MTALIPGKIYTMSTSKRCGDRSWSHDMWEVIEVNATHALIVNPNPRSYYSFGKEPMIVEISDFTWADASDLFKAAADYAKEDKA